MEKEEILSKLAQNIRLERVRKKYSQEKLAELAGITQKYLNLIENEHANPSIVIVLKICEALNIEPNILLN